MSFYCFEAAEKISPALKQKSAWSLSTKNYTFRIKRQRDAMAEIV